MKFCSECGFNLESAKEASNAISDTENLSQPPIPKIPIRRTAPGVGERKHVTVLFSDLSGYTTMSEKLDPEEVKEITSRIFGEVSKIVANYDGFIEKYAGDAVMAIFGVPQAHEDDPIRATKAAREIHQLVDAISPEVEKKIGQSISMHTGINTGLVVTGEVNLERGTHGVAGDTINLASRFSTLAKPGEIVVDVDTCRQVEGYFACEYIETTTVKGKSDPVQVHKVISQRDKPVTIRRLSGLRSDLVGRNVEMAELSEAVEDLRQGKGRIFSICGAAGTGKSRLVEEFKARLDLEQVQWIEGHAYAYSQNIAYFPLVDLLNRLLHIEEKDPPEKVREKVESGIEHLVGKRENVVPYVGGLYSLSYPEIENVSPEFWKSRLQLAILSILTSLADRVPTIFFLEDLHWADPSFVDLLRRTCLEMRQPAIVLCAYRPTFSLFTGHQLSSIGKYYHEIQLQNLSLSVAQNMLESLLKSETIPLDLKRWVQSKAEGNPFYLEELVNTLIESDTLTRDNGSWKLTRSITESDIPSSLHGLISGRLDRLEKQTKRILQEASVIGRDFLYEILRRITELEERIDGELSHLERLDLIRARSLQPDLEYMFKHALTQEIVYNGLLKKQRRKIHEQIAQVMESVFKDRLAEFNETLAYHFARGLSVAKAVDYLVKSGEKSLARYAVEESHLYFKEAYEILKNNGVQLLDKNNILIELLNKWALTLYYLGAFRKIEHLFEYHKDDAETLGNQPLLGMYYIWLGMGLYCRERYREADQNFSKSLQIGRTIEDEQVIAYAHTWLCWSRVDLGKFADVSSFAKEARGYSENIGVDDYPYYKASGGEALASFMAGNSQRNKELGEMLLTLGKQKSHIRALVLGHTSIGKSHDSTGDFPQAIENFRRAVHVAKDPMYEQYSRFFMAMSFLQNGQVNESEEAFEEVIAFCDRQGFEAIGTPAKFYLGFIQILNGQMSKGMKTVETILQRWIDMDRKPSICMAYLSLGKLYAQIASGTGSVSIKTMLKNVGFIIKNVPNATKKSEEYLLKAVESAGIINAAGMQAQALFELGMLYKQKGNKEKAINCLKEATKIFNDYGNHVFLEKAQSALESF